jgi:hypothetical protein
MIRVAMIAAAAMTWACAAQPQQAAAPATPPAQAAAPADADECGMARFTYLIGQHESAIPRDRLPPGARVICATCMVTQDFRADRLNFQLGADGRVGSIRCG